MENAVKIKELENSNIYVINDDKLGTYYLLLPKKIISDIKIFMVFDNDDDVNIQNKLEVYGNKVDKDNITEILLMVRDKDNLLSNGNNYESEFIRIKGIVNTVYNFLISNNINKELFIRKIELIDDEGKYNDFIDWLVMVNSKRFTKYGNNVVLNNSAFVSWYGVLIILFLSIVVGIIIPIFIVK